MTYNKTVEWIFKQLPMFQNIGQSAYKTDLHNTKLLAEHLNFPEKKFKSIHVGGTNGKGSTSSIIASVLQEAGYKVGLFTSPHLKDFRERICINGEKISEKEVVDFIENHKDFIHQHQFSFFELTFAMATSYFANQQVDIAIIEVGLGGRLDATNIINPILSIITNIGFDHQNILGNTIEAIAKEKAGIIKPHTPIIIGEYSSETKQVFKNKAEELSAPIWFVEDFSNLEEIPSDLQGSYQIKNKKNVQVALNIIKQYFTITKEHIYNGFANVCKNTALKGRWQILSKTPLVIADTAHNQMGLEQTIQQIHHTKHKNLHIVFGVVNDKKIDEIIKILPKNACYYLAKPEVPRGLAVEQLAIHFSSLNLNYQNFTSVKEAYQAALNQAEKDDLIYIGGSTFVVAEIL